MKRYLLFTGHNYNPIGGMYDFEKDFDDFKLAREYAEERYENYDWAHIYDLQLKKEVWGK